MTNQIDNLIAALQDAKNRGLEDIGIRINSELVINIDHISVSEITGCILYVENWEKGIYGYKRKFGEPFKL